MIPRPSTLYYLTLCPGYQSVPGDSGKDAERGTLLHECVEKNTPENAANEFDRDQVVRAMKVRDDIIAGLPQDPPPRLFPELRLTSRLHPNGGTADLVVLSVSAAGEVEADILDYKFGFNPVAEPGKNPQIMSYVLMVLEALAEVSTVRAHLIFPSLGIKASHTFTREDIPAMAQAVSAVGQSATDDPAAFTPGQACTYCARCATCPRILRDAAPTLADVARTALAAPTEANALVSLFSMNPAMASDDDLRRARTVAKATQDMLDTAVKAIDAEIIERGADLFGYAVRKRKGSLSIKDLSGFLWFLSEEIPELFSNETSEGVTNLLTLLSETEPNVPVTRLFPALARLLEDNPDRRPLRYAGLSVTKLRETVLSEAEAFSVRKDAKILARGPDTEFVAKKPGLGYESIFAGIEAIDAAADE